MKGMDVCFSQDPVDLQQRLGTLQTLGDRNAELSNTNFPPRKTRNNESPCSGEECSASKYGWIVESAAHVRGEAATRQPQFPLFENSSAFHMQLGAKPPLLSDPHCQDTSSIHSALQSKAATHGDAGDGRYDSLRCLSLW